MTICDFCKNPAATIGDVRSYSLNISLANPIPPNTDVSKQIGDRFDLCRYCVKNLESELSSLLQKKASITKEVTV